MRLPLMGQPFLCLGTDLLTCNPILLCLFHWGRDPIHMNLEMLVETRLKQEGNRELSKWEDNIKYNLCEPLPVAGQVVSPLRASPGNGTSCVVIIPQLVPPPGEVHKVSQRFTESLFISNIVSLLK